jgi:phenylpropionate dioxygenase-like ring-hydroxylating dioxygenase large terminal subunit
MRRIPAERYTAGSVAGRAWLERENERLWPRAWLVAAHLAEVATELEVDLGVARVVVSAGPRARTATGDVRCASFAGFAWVCLAPEGPSLEAYLGELGPLVAAYDLGSWALEVAVTTEVACNWKASVDAHNEGYHVHALHPEVLPMVDDTAARVDHFGDHGRIVVPMGRPSARLGRADDGTARRAIKDARRARIAGLDDDQLSDSHQFFVFPNLHVNASAEETQVMRHRPDVRDPERARFDLYVLRRGGRSTARVREVAPDDPVFGPVTGADLRLLPELQRGMRSRGFAGLYLSSQEACIAAMHESLERWLA